MRPTFLVAMWRGGAPIGIAVQEVLEYHSIHADHIAIRTSSYSGHRPRSIRPCGCMPSDYLVSRLSAEDELLLVDDVFDSGHSLEAVIRELRQRCRRNWPERMSHRHGVLQVRAAAKRAGAGLLRAWTRTSGWSFPHEIMGLTREEILAHKPVGADFLRTPTSKDPDVTV